MDIQAATNGARAHSSQGKTTYKERLIEQIKQAGGTLFVYSWKEFRRMKACLTQEGGDYAPLAGKTSTMHQVRLAHEGDVLTVNHETKS